MEKLIQIGEKLGLAGKELADFITDQQNRERERKERKKEEGRKKKKNVNLK